MAEIVRLLRREHMDMAVLLDLLERQITAFKSGGEPDYAIVRGILDYYLSYPDLYHHPKEDLIYQRLRRRDPEKAAEVEDILHSHKDLAMLVRRFASATIDQMLGKSETPREWFGSLARSFVDSNRAHMVAEEERFLPLVLQVLSPEDWAEIDAQVTDEADPLFGDSVEARFQALHESIVSLDRKRPERRKI